MKWVSLCLLLLLVGSRAGPGVCRTDSRPRAAAGGVPTATFCPLDAVRMRGGAGSSTSFGASGDIEAHRMWQACAVACHAAYLYGSKSEGDHLTRANMYIKKAREDRVAMAESLEAVESTEHWTLFTAANSSILIMSWRGTKPHRVEDLIADLDCAQFTARELCEAGGVHSGFWKRATDTVSIAKLRTILLRDEVSSLVLCGHSLGGAVAVLNAARLVKSLDMLKSSCKAACLEKIRCLTFGAPQVADERAAGAIDSMLPKGAILNFVHHGDIVPKLLLLNPSVASKIGEIMHGVGIGTFALGIQTLLGPRSRSLRETRYHPVGWHAFMRECLSLEVCSEAGEAKGRLSTFRIGDGIHQHKMVAYEKALRAAMEDGGDHDGSRSIGRLEEHRAGSETWGEEREREEGVMDRREAAVKVAMFAAKVVGAGLMSAGKGRGREDGGGGMGEVKGALELGVGLVNIGVGLYNAYQVSRGTVERLDEVAGKLGDKMDTVITLLGSSAQKTERELNRIGGMLQFQEEAALAERVLALQQVWMRCYDAMQSHDEGAIACEAPAMLESADSLAAFTWARLRGLVNVDRCFESDYAHISTGLVTMDLIKALVLSASVQLEGQCVLVSIGKRRGVSCGSANAALDLLRARVEMLCSQNSIYGLGVTHSASLLQYLNLYQGLSRQRSLALSTSSWPGGAATYAIEAPHNKHASAFSSRVLAIGAFQGSHMMGAAAADEKEEDGVEEDKEDDGNNGEAGAMQTYGCHGKQDVAASGRSEVDVSRAIGRIEVFVRQMRAIFGDAHEEEGGSSAVEEEASVVPLCSLELHAWNAQLRCQTAEEYNPRLHTCVTVASLLSRIGAPTNSTLPTRRLEALRAASLPSYTSHLTHDIALALGFRNGETLSIRMPAAGQSSDGGVEYQHALEAEHRLLDGEHVPVSAVEDMGKGKKEPSKKGLYECRPGEDLGGPLATLRGKRASGGVNGVGGWDACRVHCDAVESCKAFTFSLYEERCWMHDAVPASGRGHAKDDRVACLHSQRIQGRGGYKTSLPTPDAFKAYNCTPGVFFEEHKDMRVPHFFSNKRGVVVTKEWCQRMCDLTATCVGISVSSGEKSQCRLMGASRRKEALKLVADDFAPGWMACHASTIGAVAA